ncbi:MAG: DUF11 domain-containing protein [Phaeodactylibacter sp.]|nr:DUF11 domain-containing protein [Phaeodactylibacter sp.]
MKDRYQAFNEKTIAKFLMRGWLYPTAFFFLLGSILPSAGAQCVLRISSVDVSCNYANGANEFSVAVTVEYQAGGTISPIQVSVGGQSQLFTPAAPGGAHTFSGFSLPSPGMGYPVTAQFTNGNACQVFSTADAIACTPACPGTPASLGGMAWAEVTPDGAFDSEPGQPNVKVEVYDCEGQLRGTAFTNAEGHWSVSGLNAGEEYRVEFSAQQVPGISPSLSGPDNGSPVQFATAGDCAVNAAFLDLSAGDCFNRENAAAADCSGPPNVLDWSAYAEGANPFSRPPFSVDVNTDKVSWARTMDGATPYAHKVYHSRFGGEEAYYLLETEANNNTPGSESGVGAVFAFSRPVAGLSFTLLDIDISGSAIDRVAVHGFIGGAPVPLSLPEITAGSAVSVLEPFLFEGASPVGDDSNAGNVAIRFNEPVDQVAITLFSVAAADLGSVAQSIGIGNMSWCREPAPLSPGCTRIFDWMAFPDNDDGPTPYVMDEVELVVTGSDPFGIASGSAFMVDNDFSPEGGQRGFWGIAMDASAPDQFVESTIAFSQPVSLLTFTILDIDQADWDGLPGFSYQDQVSVRGFLGGEEVLLSLSDITPGSGGLGSVVGVSSPNLYAGNGRGASGTSADGNLTVAFPQEVDSVVVRLSPGPNGPSNPAAQQIGLSDINFCICEPAPLQLGDLIWEDENGNGVQDACEPPLAGLPVALYDEAGTLLATTRSSPLGRYHFTRSGTVGENWLADGQVEPNTSYFIVLGAANDSLPNDYTWVNGEPYLITTRFVGAGANPFMNDSDPDPNNLSSNMPGGIPGRLPYIKVTTGGPGQVNTTLDAGFRPARFDMALRKVVHEDLTPPPFAPGDIVSFVITVYNQGAIPADSLRIADYYPSDALVLEDTANWSVVNGAAVSRNALPAMAPGDYHVLSISFRIKPSFTGDTIINRAEIYQAFNSIDADDEDSFPDLIPDNDAGGAPGSGADDAVDGDGTGPVNGTDAATDEDDHDAALIVVDGAPAFDLALDLTLDGDGPFYPGDNVTFIIEVINEGALDATAVQLNNYIPAGLILDDPQWTAANGTARLVAPIASLPTGSSAFREITFQVAPGFSGPSITNTAEIAAAGNALGESDGDSTPGNQVPSEDDQASATLSVTPVFDLSLVKEVVSPGPFSPGSSVTFSIRITNEGTIAAQNVQISDYIPYGLTLNHNSWSVTGNVARLNNLIPNIAPGNTVTRQITFVIDPNFWGTSLVNTAEIQSASNTQGLDDRDSTPGNGSTQEDDDGNATIAVQQPTPVFDLALKKEVNYAETPGPFNPGDYISFNITVVNEGNVNARSIQVADHLPEGLVLDDPGWISYGDLAVIASPISSLEGGQSVTVTIRLRIEDDFRGEELVNEAEVYSVFNDDWLDDVDSNPGNGIGVYEDDEGAAIVPVEQEAPAFDLALTKKIKTSATPGPFFPGSTVTFTIRVSNEGNIDASQVSIIDYIPPGLELADPNWSQVFGSAVLNTPISNLAAGATAGVDITFVIRDNFTGLSITNKAEVNSATNSSSMPDEDSSPANGRPGEDDMDEAVVQVRQTYDLALAKTLNTTLTPGPFQPGGQVAFNLTVYNQGSLAAANITLYDYYPPGLILNDNNWQAVQGNILRLASPIPSLAPGQSVTVPILFDISPNLVNGDSLVNCAEIGGPTNVNGLPDADSTPANGSHDEDDDDTETIWITVPKRFDLALSKTVNTAQTPPPYYPGSTVSYRITVKNEGDETARNVHIQDYIPQGLILTSADWSALGSIAQLNSPISGILPGDSATVDITFAISPVFQGTALANYAEIAPATTASNPADADSTPGNGSAGPGEDDYDGAAITVSRQDFDLSLRKRVKSSVTPGPFVPGSTVTFEIEISNEGDLLAQNIQLREYFPAGLILADPFWNAVGNVAELAFPIGSLAPGATTVVDVTFTVAPGFSGASLANYAEVGSAFNILGYDDMDSTPGNGSLGPDEDDYDGATITVLQQEFDLALSKALQSSATPGPFFPGSLVTYRITVANEGDLEAQNVQLRDYIPLGLALADNNWTLNGSMAVRNIGNLAPGSTASFYISFTVSSAFTGSVLVNRAEVGAASNTMGIPDKDSTPGNGAAGPNEDDYDDATINIIQDEFDLALTKELNASLTPGPFVPGNAVTFRLTVTNQGDLVAQNIQLRDYVPIGLILADNNWTLNGSTAVRNIGNLQPGASATVNISFTISPTFSGQLIANFAEVGAASNIYGLPDTDSTPGNGPAGPNEDDYGSATIDIIQAEFDLALTKELNTTLTPGPFVPGSAVTYRLTLSNEGEVAAQNVQLWDYIPLGLILADNNWSSNGNIASRTVDNLAPGASITFNITFTIASNFSGTAIANYAEIGAAANIYGLDDRDSTPGNSSSGTGEDDFDGATINVVQQPFDLALTKELKASATPGPFYPGSTVTFRITVTNEGGIAAQNVQVRDYIPLGLILADNNWTLNGSMAVRNIGVLQPGAVATVDISFTISPNFTGLFITNYAEIGAASNTIGLGDTDSTPGNGSAGFNEDDFDSAGITVNPPQQFDLTLSKSVSSSTPGPYLPGSPVTFRLTVTNQGNVAAQNIQLWDYLPPGLTLSDNTWTLNGGLASYNTPIASLAAGASQTVEIDFVVAAGAGGTQIVNYAEIGAASNSAGLNDTDSTPGNGASGGNEDDYDSASINITAPQVFDLALSKSVSSSTPGPYSEGSPVTFVLAITNQGNVTAQSIQLWDYLPAGLTLSDNTWTANGGVASYSTPIASLAPGAVQTVEIDFVVAPGFAGTQAVNYAEIGAAFNGGGLNDTDSTPGNGASGANEDDYDSASISIVVPQVFDLALSKSVSSSTPGPYVAGSPVTFRLRVTNQGNVAAQNIQLLDYLPAGLMLSDNTWTASGGIASLNTPIASLAPGATQDVEIDFTVASGFAGTQIMNYAEIGAAANAQGLNDVDSTPGNGASAPGEDDYDDSSINVTAPQVFDLALSKAVSPSTPGPYSEGSAVTFILTVTNEGNVAAQNIQVWDYLPAGLTLSDNTWTASGGTASLNTPIASLAPGATQTVEIDFVVAPGFAGTVVSNFAEIFSATNGAGLSDADSTPGNGAAGSNEDDFDSANITISAAPVFDLALRKRLKTSATPGPFSPGSAVTFRITVMNQGNMDAYNIEVVDYIPAGLSLSDPNWVQTGAIARRTIPGPVPPNGGTAALDISFVIAQDFTGNTIVNFAEIRSADDDTNPGNTAPVDVDSQYDENPANDAGGLAGSPSDDALNGDGTGQPGSSSAVTDEDDQDPALITVGNCPGAGLDGAIDVCLTCTSTNVTVDLPAALGGIPSPGGTWTDLDGAGVSLANPASVSLGSLASGDYRFRYTVGGQNGCPVVSAIVTVSLASNLDYGCNAMVNVPLGDRCEVLVVPDMILEGGSDGCADGLIVNLLDPNGVSLGNVITVAQAGQTLIAEVLDPFCGLVCWGYVNVQDFTPPAISCPVQDVDLICSDLDSILNNPASLAITGTPVIYDTCVQNTVTFQDQMVMTPDCVDRQINRTFTVTDPLGNSAQCTQVITIRNPDFADLLPLPALVEIPCDSSFAVDQNGNPHPSVTGYPLVQTYFGAIPLNQAFCSLGASYTDSAPIVVCDGTTRFIRRWDILDWCVNSGNNILQLTQSIKVGDVDGPIVSCPEIDITGDGYPDPLQFSTVPYECTGAFVAPLPNVTDNCSGWEVRTEIVTDEVVPVTNQYGIIIGYDTVATILATILPGAPRFVSGIPVGCHRFRYKVTDDCNNFTLLECNFCVVDDVEPTAVCNDSLNISIGGQGVGRVYATDVNEGSTDNCGIDSLLVRRRFDVDPVTCDSVVPYYSDWAPYVDFFCCDVNQTVTVELLVIDVHGNENTCWLTALVEDKVRPVCYAPNDITVSCSSLPANFDPYDTSQLQALFGAATATDGCGGAIAVEQPPAVNLDQCGAGTVIRTFQGVDLAGNLSLSACTQVITIGAEFNYQIKFPKDVTTNCTAPTPDTLIYDSFGCDLLSVSVTDEVFTPLLGGTGPECYKIFRKYRVLNWCEYDGVSDAVVIGRNEDCDGVTGDEDVWVVRQPGGAFVDRDNNPQNTIPAFGAKGLACDGTTNPTGYWRTVSSVGLWEYTQIIKVMDTIPPQVSFTVPGAFCSYDAANCTGQVTYPFSVSEDCSANGLDVEVFLDAGADGVIDQDLTNTGTLSGSYPNFTIQGVFPVGNHAFIVQASDGCGNNMASATLPFEVVDCAPPAFTCLNGLSFNLMPLPPNTDFDGDGDFDIAGAAIWASDFVLDAADCSDDTIAYSINLVGQAPDINRRALYFTCEDTGTIAIQVYVWDSADNPYAIQPDSTVGGFNFGYCDTYVIVQDNNNACNAGLMMAGLIAREDDMGVEGVEVSLSGPMNLMMLTDVDGSYQFDDLETGYDYTIRPYLNTGHRNGISTFDLLIIQQHLLGVQPLNSPYKRIAADANRTNSITTLDMIQIQQLILGEILEFPNNTSWRFVDKNFVFPVPLNPWFTPFPEVININDLAYPQMANDFVAIKIGDVNNSAVTTNLQRVQGRRLAGTFYLEAPALSLAIGETVAVPVSGRNLEAIRGCQFTLDFDQSALELIDIEYGLADKNSIGLHGVPEGYLTGSWYRRDELEYPEGEPLFTLRLRAKADGPLSRFLSVSSRYTLAEAYTPGNELLDVSLAFGGGGPLPEPAFRLYQNRPNPFSEETVVGFELPESGAAQLKVYDVNGKVVYEQERVFEKGYNQLILKGADLSPGGIGGGVLYYRLQMGDRVVARKMIMLE